MTKRKFMMIKTTSCGYSMHIQQQKNVLFIFTCTCLFLPPSVQRWRTLTTFVWTIGKVLRSSYHSQSCFCGGIQKKRVRPCTQTLQKDVSKFAQMRIYSWLCVNIHIQYLLWVWLSSSSMFVFSTSFNNTAQKRTCQHPAGPLFSPCSHTPGRASSRRCLSSPSRPTPPRQPCSPYLLGKETTDVLLFSVCSSFLKVGSDLWTKQLIKTV